MKKLFLLSLLVVILGGCQRDNNQDLENNNVKALTEEEVKVIALHYQGNSISLDDAIDEANAVLGSLGNSTKSSNKRTVKNVEVVTGSRDFLTKGGGIMDGSDTLIYIVNFTNEEGFVLVSGDTRTEQILAASETGNINVNEEIEESSGVNVFLANAEILFEEQIMLAEEKETKLLDEVLAKIGEGEDTRSRRRNNINVKTGAWENVDRINPLVQVTWGQRDPYNNNAPLISGQRPPAGCVATAIAQVMSYHRFPLSYNWSTINQHTNSRWGSHAPAHAEIARLFRTIADNVNMQWGLNRSGAWVYDAPSHFSKMGYRNTGKYQGYNFDKIKLSILDRLPVIISGYAIEETYKKRKWFLGKKKTYKSYKEGHAWVIDGLITRRRLVEVERRGRIIYSYYQYESLVNCNYGWNGMDDGYYNSAAFDTNKGPVTRSGESGNYQFKLEMLTDIKPR